MRKLLLAAVTALCLPAHANAGITIGGQPADGVPVRGNGLPKYRCTVEHKIVIRSRPNGPIIYIFEGGIYAYVFDKQGKWFFVEGSDQRNDYKIVGAGWTNAPTLKCLKIETSE